MPSPSDQPLPGLRLAPAPTPEILVEPLGASHLEEALRVFRTAFGTHLQMPEPEKFGEGIDFHTWRREMYPEGAWVAREGDRVVGSILVSQWGSFGFFGPLTIAPSHWNRGIAQRLLLPAMDCFEAWGTRLDGLFTFSSSPKHLMLYQKYGFLPGHLLAIMNRKLDARPTETLQEFQAYSRMEESQRADALAACRDLSNALFEGLDLTREIESVARHQLGETVLLRDGREVEAFAICHHGAGSEAGPGATYVKFGAARPGRDAAARFERLLEACEAYARGRGARALVVGMNTGRREAYASLLRNGYRIGALGVAMHRGKAGHYHREHDFVIEDLR